MTDMVERVAEAMRAEFVKQGRAGGNWSDKADDLTGYFGLDGNFDLDAVARAAIEAVKENLLMELRKEVYGNNDPEKIGFESATAIMEAALSPNQKE